MKSCHHAQPWWNSMLLVLFHLVSVIIQIRANEVEIFNDGDQLAYDEEHRVNVVPKSHALFSLNYATNDDDNTFNVWNHAVLEHWDRKISRKYPRGISYRVSKFLLPNCALRSCLTDCSIV